MTQSLRQIKRRIRSVESIAKLTRAMEMISIAKLRPFQAKLAFAKEYFSKVEQIWNNFLPHFEPKDHPFLAERPDKHKITLCLITSDTGLCGSYNSDILRCAKTFIAQHKGKALNLVTVGKKGFVYFKKAGLAISDAYIETHGRYQQAVSDKIALGLMNLFLSGDADEVYVAYTSFNTAARRRPVAEKILNIAPVPTKAVAYTVEPGKIAFLNDLAPFFLIVKMRFMMLSSFAAEHSARGMAMGEATDNAKDMLQSLTLLRNKIRQANITREIIEVISSSDALKG